MKTYRLSTLLYLHVELAAHVPVGRRDMNVSLPYDGFPRKYHQKVLVCEVFSSHVFLTGAVGYSVARYSSVPTCFFTPANEVFSRSESVEALPHATLLNPVGGQNLF